MKKLITTDISSTALLPIKQGTLNHLQSAYQECITAILNGHLGGSSTGVVYVISGCLVTISGGNYTVSAGAIYYNGTVYLMDAKTSTPVPSGGNTYVCNIKTTYVTAANADPVTFTDGNTHNVHQIQKAEIESGASGSGISDYEDFVSIPMQTGSYLDLSAWSGAYTFDFQIDRNFYFSSTSNPEGIFTLQNARIGCKQKVYASLTSGETIIFAGSGASVDISLVLPKTGTCTLYTGSAPTTAITTTQQYVIEMEYLGILNGNPRLQITIFGL